MRTLPAALAALALVGSLAACTAQEPTTEALPDSPPSVLPPTPSAAVDDPAPTAEELYAEYGIDYPGEPVVEEVSLGLCAQIESDSVAVAFRDLILYGGYDDESAAMAMTAAVGVYCPEHRDAVEEWGQPLPAFGE